MKQTPQPTPMTQVRIESDLKTWLKHAAIDNGRTLQQEVVYRLEESRRLQAGNMRPQGAAA
ncbi:hypothetical protein HMPREF9701_05506 [Delftia acidovorans CCUG 274B]|jgi:hypothetical protein|nr:hypothetical protein HMPREF9701_05506 [Delftia acidovorans CCUG 274B]